MRTWRYRLNRNECQLWNHEDEDLGLWWRHELAQWAAVEAQALGFNAYAVCDAQDRALAEGVVLARQ